MTVKSLLAGSTFVHCLFKGSFKGPNWTMYRQMDGTYIYKQDFAQQYDKCGARSGLPQLFLNKYVEGYETHYMTTYTQYTYTDIYKHVHTYTIL